MATELGQGGMFANFRMTAPYNAGSHATHCSTRPKSPFLSVLQNECQTNTVLKGYTFNRSHTLDTNVNKGGLPHPLPQGLGFTIPMLCAQTHTSTPHKRSKCSRHSRASLAQLALYK